MPAYIEIAYDDHDTVIECILPNTEYWFTYHDPVNSLARAMIVSCRADDTFTEVSVGDIEHDGHDWEMVRDGAPTRLTHATEEVWEISNSQQVGLLAVSHSALLVSDSNIIILD